MQQQLSDHFKKGQVESLAWIYANEGVAKCPCVGQYL